ncbi:MAG: hypothetical protein JNL34_11365 [Anaerolineae bacterium]|nr:hypothetical protein [Anaerolineae bacterium]
MAISLDQFGLWIGFALTLMVFSYLLGDNFLYRIAVYALSGLTAGILVVVTFENLLLPFFGAALSASDIRAWAIVLFPVLLGVLLLLKGTRRYGHIGNLGLAYMVGVGAAVALVGAVSGTLVPLVSSTAAALRPPPVEGQGNLPLANGFVLVLGVICTLIYFQHLARRVPGSEPGQVVARRRPLTRTLGAVGQGFIAIALGALYGGAILSGLAVLSERMAFLLSVLGGG